MRKLLIKNGLLVTPDGEVAADLLTEDGKIAAIGTDLEDADAAVIDAAGKIVFPGFIDPHTHMYLVSGTKEDPCPTADNFETGTRSALCGGTTTIIDHATQDKGMSLPETVEKWHALADGVSSTNYAFHMGIADWNEQAKKDIEKMPELGVTSFKVYLAYNALRLDDDEIYEIIRAADRFGGVVTAHCENGPLVNELIGREKAAGHLSPSAHPKSRPDYVEGEAVDRFLAVAEAADVPVYVVHLSTARGLEACRAARARGQKLYIESCPQYFYLDESQYDLPDFEGAKVVFAPPARKKADRAALTGALETGEIDTIGSDQCSFNFKGAKERGKADFSKIPNGIPGAETRPVLMYTRGVADGHMSLKDFAAVMSTNAAKIFGMYPQKGALLPGSDADIVIWDPKPKALIHNRDLHHACDYTPYENTPVIGRPETVILGGEIAVQDGEILKPNAGRYVARSAKTK